MSIGQALRDARISRGLSLQDISEKIKVRVSLLSLIEVDQFKKVGAPTYVRGHITAYANLVGLDAKELLKGFEDYSGDTPLDKPAREAVSKFETKLDEKLNLEKVSKNAREIKTNSGFNWTTLMVAALGLVFVVGIFSFVTRVNQETVVPPLADTLEIEVVEETPTEQIPVAPDATEDNLTASKDPDLVFLVLEATDGNSWVRASNLDDETIFEGTIRRNESQTISNLDEVRLLVGNAGALNVSLNGQPFGKIGGNGEVKRCSATFTFLECN
ncbi:MAG: helix-turn-helix domain-containing protein [Candidatus Nanopelagicales bacterium]